MTPRQSMHYQNGRAFNLLQHTFHTLIYSQLEIFFRESSFTNNNMTQDILTWYGVPSTIPSHGGNSTGDTPCRRFAFMSGMRGSFLNNFYRVLASVGNCPCWRGRVLIAGDSCILCCILNGCIFKGIHVQLIHQSRLGTAHEHR